jgi:hypothetical protein
MKLKAQFGKETHFDRPIRCANRTGAQWPLNIWVLLCVLAMAERQKPITHHTD